MDNRTLVEIASQPKSTFYTQITRASVLRDILDSLATSVCMEVRGYALIVDSKRKNLKLELNCHCTVIART